MSEKRKDRKGRILKSGESQRGDGRYMYRFSANGKRQYVYAQTLDELREKERQIQRDISDGINYSGGLITVTELLERYEKQRNGVRPSTKDNHSSIIKVINERDFSKQKIRDIKKSDAKAFMVSLQEDGYSYSTIDCIRYVLKPAFDMAIEDDILRKNPFSFKLGDVIEDDTVSRQALSQTDKAKFLDYIKSDSRFCKCYDAIVILLGTGLRISELCGLTVRDVDFKERTVNIDKQLLLRAKQGGLYIQKPKTSCGVRKIPILEDDVYWAFRRAILTRGQFNTEYIVDGKTGFIFLTQSGKPKTATNFEHSMRMMVRNYNKTHIDQLPNITPHVLRHTFCTEKANAGLDLKSLQYLMGHNDASTTLNIYVHSDYESARKALLALPKTGT